MSLQLQPGNSFTVVRQLNNPYITDTFYVKAVIRNAYTDAIIDTLQLTDKGGQRFKKDWQVPADPSGQGFYISIVTSVYSDSGYTTKSENYGDEESTYLVADRLLNAMRGGGDNSLDLYSIRKVIQEELNKGLEKVKPEPVKIPKQKVYEMRWEEVLSSIDDLKTITKKIPVVQKSYDTQFASIENTVVSASSQIVTAIQEKEVTPAPDFTPVREQMKKNLDATLGVLERIGESLITVAQKAITSQLGKIQANLSFNSAPIVQKEPTKSPLQPIDLNKLSL